MTKTSIVAALALIALVRGQICPAGGGSSGVVSDTLNIGTGGTLLLQNGLNVQCYNYTFPVPFSTMPQIAVGTIGLEAPPSSDMSYYVRPVQTNNPNAVTFQVRTPWRLTAWSRISVSFLAETRSDFEVGSRMLDTAMVGGCSAKSLGVWLQFNQQWTFSSSLVLRVFFNGFSASTPGSTYDIRMASATLNNTGAVITVAINGNSVFDVLYASYVIFDKNTVQGEQDGMYERGVMSTTSFSIMNGVSSAAIYGISGFEFNSGSPISLNVRLDSSNITIFVSTTQYNFISVSYFVLLGTCANCRGYPLLSGANCVQACPFGSYNQSGVCMQCGPGTQWNGYACVQGPAQCPANSTFNFSTNRCQCNANFWNISGICQQCPNGGQWNGFTCVVNTNCGQNSFFNPSSQRCQCNSNFYNISGFCQQCPQNTQWNGAQCVQIQTPCPPNTAFNFSSSRCDCISGFFLINGICQQCPSGTQWNGFTCAQAINCGMNAFFNQSIQGCQCNQNYYNISGTCQMCAIGTSWNGYTCAPVVNPNNCGPNAYWDPSVGCRCNNGFNNISGSCQTCPPGTTWNGNTCVGGGGGNGNPSGPGVFCPPGVNCVLLCSNYPNTVFDSSTRQCVCSSNTYWMNGRCQSCPNGFVFNGNTCIRQQSCPPFSIPIPGGCSCIPGYTRVGTNCVPSGSDGNKCPDGNYWNKNRQRCQACTSGCKVCTDGNTCRICEAGFVPNKRRGCSEICGDGVRFVLSCDDNNTVSGDGCSSSCRVEEGWSCFGGSPNSRDYCSRDKPSKILIVPTGQTRTQGKVATNVRLSWMPTELVQTNCEDCLQIRIESGPSPQSIRSRYIKGTSYSFSNEFDFSREPIPDFSYSVRINPNLQDTYFRGIDISDVETVSVSPVLLAKADDAGTLDLNAPVAMAMTATTSTIGGEDEPATQQQINEFKANQTAP